MTLLKFHGNDFGNMLQIRTFQIMKMNCNKKFFCLLLLFRNENVNNIHFDQVHIFRLSTLPQIQNFIETMDLAFYQVLTEVLFPDVLRTLLTGLF